MHDTKFAPMFHSKPCTVQVLTESQSICDMAVDFQGYFLRLQRQLLRDLSLGFREIKQKLPVLAALVANPYKNVISGKCSVAIPFLHSSFYSSNC